MGGIQMRAVSPGEVAERAPEVLKRAADALDGKGGGEVFRGALEGGRRVAEALRMVGE